MCKANKTRTTFFSEAARQARAAYAREWREKNPEKEREIKLRYWERKAQKRAEAETDADGKAGA